MEYLGPEYYLVNIQVADYSDGSFKFGGPQATTDILKKSKNPYSDKGNMFCLLRNVQTRWGQHSR
jgi:hypothetical protein